MTIYQPTTNLEAMRELSQRVDAMIAVGSWDEQAWNAALDEAADYANSASGGRDWLLSEALDPAWLERRLARKRAKAS